MAEEWDNKLIVYLYDASGAPIGMMYRTTSYAEGSWDTFWYEKNLQGDIVAVYNESGTKVVSYSYTDAWGNHSVTYPNGDSTPARYNPFRYRGYYYDTELLMYYLQSRYYDPATGRFINADGYVSTGQGIHSCNMYVYCANNPVNRIDPSGKFFLDNNNLLDDFLLEGGGAGGYGGSGGINGAGTAIYTNTVRINTALSDASLGGYYFGGGGHIGGYTASFAIGNVSVTDSMVVNNSVYTSRGSTGRTTPNNLKEQLAMEQVKSNPLEGAYPLRIQMKDPRWPSYNGWVKMAQNINGVEIHFLYNTVSGYYDDFKFKG